ncbi:MAG: hypothetical protein QOK43_2198 [Acidimicrobiaceae bacterium]|nr:hypothetical protein [Acidimicrobiaceae bacterium]
MPTKPGKKGTKSQADPTTVATRARESLGKVIRRDPERHPLILALVAPVGTPLDDVETALRDSLRRFGYGYESVRLSDLLDTTPFAPWGTLPKRGEREYYRLRMNAGDELRGAVGNAAALAALAVTAIVKRRGPKPKESAFVLRSLKNPSEVHLLRHVYGDAFLLVAVASSIEERRQALADHLSLFENPRSEAENLIARDESDSEEQDFGQNVRAVYSMADVYLPSGRGLIVAHEVDRFIDAVFGAPFATPRPAEEAMRLAFDASLRSAAAGRQVGATIVPRIGTPMIVGTNEVPKPGGGQYWSGDVPDYRDFQVGSDPNPVYTKRVIQEMLERLARRGWLVDELRSLTGPQLLARATESSDEGESVLEGARASALIEFTRCLHAEQSAIVNAARAGIATTDAMMYTTTFPCHECAKMIIGAGITEVHYVEPYPKSLVSRLYRDLIDTEPELYGTSGLSGRRVPFHQFFGIAPRLYATAFRAGERRVGDQIIEWDRMKAWPQTAGWNENGVRERESTVVTSISQVLNGLASGAIEPVYVPIAARAEPEDAVGSAPATETGPPPVLDAGASADAGGDALRASGEGQPAT